MNTRVGMTAFEGKRRRPPEAVRAFCVACQGGVYEAVARCSLSSCPLRPFRGGVSPDGEGGIVSVVREYCVGHCLPDQPDEVTTCQAYSLGGANGPCPLWPYRLGVDPYARQQTAEENRERQLTLLAPAPRASDDAASSPALQADEGQIRT